MNEQIKAAVDEIGVNFKAFKSQVIDAANTNFTDIKELLEEQRGRIELLESKGTLPARAGAHPASFAAKMAGDAKVKQVAAGELTSARVDTQTTLRELLAAKADLLSTVGGGGSPNTGWPVQPMRFERIGEDPRRRITIMDALPHIKTASNSVEYIRLDGYSPSAAAQPGEGQPKAEAAIPTSLQSVNVATFANWIPVSRQLLSDVPMLTSYISGLLGYAVLLSVESAIIDSGPWATIDDTAQSFSPSSSNAADAIGEAGAELNALGWNADTLLIHPTSLFAILSERASDSGVYMGQSQPYAPGTVWGLKPVPTPVMSEGEAIVLDSSQHVIFDRQQVTLLTGTINEQLTSNMLTLLLDARYAYATLSPTAAKKMTLPGGE